MLANIYLSATLTATLTATLQLRISYQISAAQKNWFKVLVLQLYLVFYALHDAEC